MILGVHGVYNIVLLGGVAYSLPCIRHLLCRTAHNVKLFTLLPMFHFPNTDLLHKALATFNLRGLFVTYTPFPAHKANTDHLTKDNIMDCCMCVELYSISHYLKILVLQDYCGASNPVCFATHMQYVCVTVITLHHHYIYIGCTHA